jgi:hypothetical protein
MKTREEFTSFYNNELLPKINELEQIRLVIKQKLTTVYLITLGIAAISLMLYSVTINPLLIALGAIIAIVFFFVSKASVSGDYKNQFKTKIVGSIVNFIEPGLTLSPGNFISHVDFDQSNIYKTYDNYSGHDLILGTIGKTKVGFSKLNVTERQSDGKNTRTVTIFEGVFWIADFNKDFNTSIVVLPDTAESMFGKVGQFFQSINLSRDSLVKMEDPEFEKLFVAYSNDQVQARYVLSPSLMKRLVDFRRGLDHSFSLSFVDSKMYLAFDGFDEFDSKSVYNKIDFEAVYSICKEISFFTDLVNDFDLNTRIWSKQ